MVPDKETLANLEAQHKRIGVVTSKDDGKSWCVVLRKPTRAEYKRYRAFAHQPARVDSAQEQLVKDTCVAAFGATAQTDLETLLEDWPGIPEACSTVIIDLAGMAGVEQGKH